jgi:hypothetical protein
MAAARAIEYRQVHDAAMAARITEGDRAAVVAVLRRLRGELRRVERRDFFPPAERKQAREAVRGLADWVAAGDRESRYEVGDPARRTCGVGAAAGR